MAVFPRSYTRARDAQWVRPRLRLIFLLPVLLLCLVACQKKTTIETPGNDAQYEIIPLESAVSPAGYSATASHHTDHTGTLLQDYRIGPADTLTLRILIADITGKEGLKQVVPQRFGAAHEGYPVDSRGTIGLPLAGTIAVGGLSLEGARLHIAEKMSDFFVDPQVELSVKDYASQQVFVSGEVDKPGAIPLTNRPLYVLSALQIAGNPLETANLSHATLSHPNGTRECIDLYALNMEGDVSQNKQLFGGDVLHVPRHHSNHVFILGEVNKPGTQTLAGATSLLDAVSSAEDIDRITAKKSDIYVLRNRTNNACELTLAGHAPQRIDTITQVYHLNIEQPERIILADQFALQPRDIVYVASRPITEWSRFITQLIPSSISNLADRNRYQSN